MVGEILQLRPNCQCCDRDPPPDSGRTAHRFSRVSSATQLTSHVLPPSSENACSKRIESGEIGVMTKRTRMARGPSVSCPKNTPRPFLNSPYTGGLTVPLRLFE